MSMTTIHFVSPIGTILRYTSLSAAQSPDSPDFADAVYLQAITENVVFTMDGSTPTANNGFILVAGNDPLLVTFPPPGQLKFIEAASGAELRLQWAKL